MQRLPVRVQGPALDRYDLMIAHGGSVLDDQRVTAPGDDDDLRGDHSTASVCSVAWRGDAAARRGASVAATEHSVEARGPAVARRGSSLER